MNFSNLLDNCLDLCEIVYVTFSSLFDWFVTPISQHIHWLDTVAVDTPWLDAILALVSAPLLVLQTLAVAVGLPSVSLAVIMLGGGCTIYVLYQFITWLLNLVT